LSDEWVSSCFERHFCENGNPGVSKRADRETMQAPENYAGDPLRLAVLISVSGRTLQNFIDLIRAGRLPARIVHVISSRDEVLGLQRARDAGIATTVITRKGKTLEAFSDRITAVLDESQAQLVCMAGFLSLYVIPDKYQGRVMNIHPALLPAFGGKGMYGDKVHQAVLDAGCKISGCTVHFADNQYDHGPIIVQRTVPVLEDDDVHSLADRVFQQELIAYPQAIELFAEGRLRIDGRKVRILPAGRTQP